MTHEGRLPHAARRLRGYRHLPSALGRRSCVSGGVSLMQEPSTSQNRNKRGRVDYYANQRAHERQAGSFEQPQICDGESYFGDGEAAGEGEAVGDGGVPGEGTAPGRGVTVTPCAPAGASSKEISSTSKTSMPCGAPL